MTAMDCFRLRSLSYGGQVAEPVIGRRFAPPKLLIEMAAKGETFYGRFAPKKLAAA